MNSSPGRDYAFRITGGSQLAGDLCVSGSKNAALPEMAAALRTAEGVGVSNVTRGSEREVMAQILTELGGRSEGEGSLVLRMGNAPGTNVPDELGRRMRATIVLLGALLGRFGQARLPRPGGDDIGARRVEQHMRGLRQMGAHIEETATEIVAEVDRLHGARIVFDLPTVTGTENILLAAVLAEGRTEIFNAAREPHVQDLCRLLGKMGAHIEGIGTERVVVDGVRELGGAEHTVIADYLEAGTYAIAVAAAGGDLRIERRPPRMGPAPAAARGRRCDPFAQGRGSGSRPLPPRAGAPAGPPGIWSAATRTWPASWPRWAPRSRGSRSTPSGATQDTPTNRVPEAEPVVPSIMPTRFPPPCSANGGADLPTSGEAS